MTAVRCETMQNQHVKVLPRESPAHPGSEGSGGGIFSDDAVEASRQRCHRALTRIRGPQCHEGVNPTSERREVQREGRAVYRPAKAATDREFSSGRRERPGHTGHGASPVRFPGVTGKARGKGAAREHRRSCAPPTREPRVGTGADKTTSKRRRGAQEVGGDRSSVEARESRAERRVLALARFVGQQVVGRDFPRGMQRDDPREW